MKTTSKIYLFITSLFFIFSPFSLGLSVIYFEDSSLSEHISGLIMNVGLLIILGTTVAILISKKKLAPPSKFEIRLLIFGILSNIVIYFYVFQNSLSIDNFMTIYFTIILVLFLYMLVIDRHKYNYELWIFAILFLIVDFIHFEYISDHIEILPENYIDANFIQRIFFITVPVTTLAIYSWKIKQYKIMDYFSYVFIGLALLITLIFVESINGSDKFILTLNLLIPFVIIVDFIVSIIYKKFSIFKITFYIRVLSIILLIYIYDGIHYFVMDSYSDHNLIELVMIIYVAIVCNLIEYLVPKKI